MIGALILIPAVSALAAFLIRHDRARRALLLTVAGAHFVLTVACWVQKPVPVLNGWLALDALGLLFLTMTSVLFLAAASYAFTFLGREKRHEGEPIRLPSVAQGGDPSDPRRTATTVRSERESVPGDELFDDSPEAVFTGCLLFFLSTMTLVAASQHFGLLWASVEATTLASAPLIYFHRNPRSLEATWKYLMVCSVGIALALLGNFFFSVAGVSSEGGRIGLLLPDLLAGGGTLQAPWLKAAFLFFLVGYGTKMGLAPLHTWLPDAHSESPSLVSALLSGALLNCAFLALLRVTQVMDAAALGDFARGLFLFFGLFSITLAMVFIMGQRDYKRLLAYSSVEHMGILSIGMGLGPGAAWAVVFHAVNHSLSKAGLFLAAGNILSRYRTKTIAEVSGLLRAMPVTGALWVAGLLAITGFPPFGTFLSEFAILREAVAQGRFALAGFFLLMLALIFMDMSGSFLAMAQGPAPAGVAERENKGSFLPPAILLLAVLFLGLYMHPAVMRGFEEAAKLIGGVSR